MLDIILFSKSPRRQELLKLMGLNFRVMTKDVDESYPENLSPTEVAEYIATKKAKAFDSEINDEILITADTIVAIDNEILGKPVDAADAFRMLKLLSGRAHDVHTGVALLHQHNVVSFVDTTKVYFRELSDDEINYYIENYQPYDKAGAYGIQEWIGLTAVTRLEGSYTNVMGLPTEILYLYLLQK
jgi:septum formation protein